MPLSKWFYLLFSSVLLILVLMLGYAGLLAYRSADKDLQATVNKIVMHTAEKLQNDNYFSYDLYKVTTDPDYKQKVAFAAGMTQNQSRLTLQFDSNKTPPSPKQDVKKKKNDSVTFTFTPTGEKPIKYSYPKNTAANGGKQSPSFVISRRDSGHISTYTINPRNQIAPRKPENVQYFDSLLMITFKKEGMVIPYHIEAVTTRIKPIPYASELFIIDAYSPDIYRVMYTLPPILMIKRLAPYTVIAVLLLLLVCGAFVLYHKSYRMQIQMSQFKESLFSNVTHELKTPLSSLQLIVSSFQQNDADLSVKQKEYVSFAGKELQRMHLLIEKILSFGKLNEEQFALNKEVIDLSDLIREAIQIMNITAANKSAEICFEPQNNADVIGDKILLLNMVISIIDNAVKYNTGSPVIYISQEQRKDDIVIRIKDNGPGIPSRLQLKIFEPFFRVPTGNEHTVKGHGLGLSFAQQVAVLHSGRIYVESEPGKGSTFIITLPS